MNYLEINTEKANVRKEYGEMVFARFFAERLNKLRGFEYQAVPNQEQSSDVDACLAGENIENLNLQLKTGEPWWERFFGQRRKFGSGWGIFDVNIETFLGHTIKSNEAYYPNKKELILLITERHQPTFDKVFAINLSNKFGNTPFRGVYIVKLPAFDRKPPYEGQIVAIKDIFGDHGAIF